GSRRAWLMLPWEVGCWGISERGKVNCEPTYIHNCGAGCIGACDICLGLATPPTHSRTNRSDQRRHEYVRCTSDSRFAHVSCKPSGRSTRSGRSDPRFSSLEATMAPGSPSAGAL